MKVRAFDSEQKAYFKSEVYAIINTGWYEKQLLLVPSDDGGRIKFIDFLDKSDVKNHPVLISTIVSDIPAEWIKKRTEEVKIQLEEYRGILDTNVLFFEFMGYPWIFKNKSIMIELLSGKSIPYKSSIFENKIDTSNIAGWNYVETHEDVESLMKQASEFHDSVLRGLNYISGSYVDSDGSVIPMDRIRKVIMRIESQWCQPVEMVFEGVTALNLRPSNDNCDSIIYCASLYTKDASVFFCDSYLEQIDKSYEGTWITAYSLRWRFVSKNI